VWQMSYHQGQATALPQPGQGPFVREGSRCSTPESRFCARFRKENSSIGRPHEPVPSLSAPVSGCGPIRQRTSSPSRLSGRERPVLVAGAARSGHHASTARARPREVSGVV